MKTVFIFVFTMLSAMLFAQSQQGLEDAFSDSYAFESVDNYTKAIKPLEAVYNANSYPVNLRLGWLHYKAGNYNQSREYYEIAVELMPYSVEAKIGLTYPVSALGNTNRLETIYKEVLKINAGNTTAHYNLAQIYYNRKNYQAAYDELEKVVNQYPFDYDTSILFAWTNYQLGKKREAKILFQRVLLMKPGDSSARAGLTLME